jgi:hypothetical protein
MEDDSHVTVHGLLSASFKKGSDTDLFSWTRKAKLDGDGVDTWWQEEAPSFGYSSLKKAQWASMHVQLLFMSGFERDGSDWRSPLLR